MKIEIETKFNPGDKVFVIYNANIAFNYFLENKDWKAEVIETEIDYIQSIRFKEDNSKIIQYKLKDIFFEVEEERAFTTREAAITILKESFKNRVQFLIDENNKSIAKIESSVPAAIQDKFKEADGYRLRINDLREKVAIL